MNNKGFAITTVLYGILILFCLLLLSMLGILSTYHNNVEKLIEENNGARSHTQGLFIGKSTFLKTPSGLPAANAMYQGHGIYNLIKPADSPWAGYCIKPTVFTNNNKYRLTYSLQKIDGTLRNIGGHSPNAKDLLFYVDGVRQEGTPVQYNIYHEVGPKTEHPDVYVAEENLPNDGEIHNVQLEFTYILDDSSNKSVCVQPNRGLNTDVSVRIFNIKLMQIS